MICCIVCALQGFVMVGGLTCVTRLMLMRRRPAKPPEEKKPQPKAKP